MTIFIVGLAIVVAWLMQKQTVKKNYAEEVATPLEVALIKGGAVKKCQQGDDGRGSDNDKPGYSATFTTNLDKSEAVQLITKIARENGYTLTLHHSPYSYIDWYSDKATKKSPYSELAAGHISLGFDLYTGGSNLGCPEKELRYGSRHTAIVLTTALPGFKE